MAKLAYLLLFLTLFALSFAETEPEEDEEDYGGEDEGGEQEEGDEGDVSYDDAENVVSVEQADFEKFVMDTENQFVFAEFYAPWCGYCRQLKPEWAQAADIAKEKNIPVKFVAVNADGMDENSPLKQYDIQGFPTIKFFHAGVPKDYEGERTAEAMIKFAIGASKEPVVDTLKTQEEIEQFIMDSSNPVIGYFAKNLDRVEGQVFPREAFDVAANNLRMEYQFAEVIDPQICEKESVSDAAIKIHLSDDSVETMTVQDGDIAQPAPISQWIAAHSRPVMVELTQHNFEQLVATTETPSFILFVDPVRLFSKKSNHAQDEEVVPAKDALKKVAAADRGECQAFYMDGVEYKAFVDHLGFSASHTLPVLAVLAPAQKNHFIFPEDKELTEDSIKQFVQDFKDKKLTRKLKSEDVPKKNDGPVFVLVGDTFTPITTDTEKDVVVMFHAPWCGHCKALMPKYTKFARALKTVPTVLIAKIDMDGNEVPPEMGIEGFPTIKLFKATDKEHPVDYEGPRTMKGLLAWLKENAGISFSLEKEQKEQKEEL